MTASRCWTRYRWLKLVSTSLPRQARPTTIATMSKGSIVNVRTMGIHLRTAAMVTHSPAAILLRPVRVLINWRKTLCNGERKTSSTAKSWWSLWSARSSSQDWSTYSSKCGTPTGSPTWTKGSTTSFVSSSNQSSLSSRESWTWEGQGRQLSGKTPQQLHIIISNGRRHKHAFTIGLSNLKRWLLNPQFYCLINDARRKKLCHDSPFCEYSYVWERKKLGESLHSFKLY